MEANNKVANKHTAEIKRMLKTQFEAYDKTIRAIAQESSSTLEKQARKLEQVSQMFSLYNNVESYLLVTFHSRFQRW